MTFHCTFDVKGIPKAQPRHQAFAKLIEKPGQKPKVMARVFQKNTAEYWKALIVSAGEKLRPEEPLEGPVQLRLLFWMPRPKRLLRKKDPAGPILHTQKPDKENLEKPIFDALKNDGWFRDDSVICLGKTLKLYHAKGGAPGAEIYIDELDELSESQVTAAIKSIRMP